ncbi:LysR substrate-binding domain-containing protein [Niveispirillum sp. KHB5.9]|uniref:LysR substrate-binding domain-containing protein n=1 Tax=Niveispirillum sp. KHB5.9 TaxID=3400269 RepID=UPI003A8B8DAB
MPLPATDLDIDALRAFVAIVDHDGFTAAAERLHRTQSAISMKIKRLETMLGRTLFDRAGRAMSLTAEGELLLSYARRMLALNDEMVARLMAPEAEGLVRFGVAEYFAPEQLPLLLARFRRAHPRVRLEVSVGMGSDLVQEIAEGRLDVVIAKRNETGPQGRFLWREPVVWVASPDWRPEAGDGPLPLCLMPDPCIYRTRAVAAMDRTGQGWRTTYASGSFMAVRAAALAGLGVTCLGAGALVPGLRVLGPAEGFPALEPVETAVFGEERAKGGPIQPLIDFLVREVQAIALPPVAQAA